MAKKRLTPRQYRNELIHRQIQVTRYATGQANYAMAMVNDLNDKIARFLIKKSFIETKSQYTDCRKFIRAKSMEYRERMYDYLQKELRKFVIEQSKWVYTNFPIKLEKVDADKIMGGLFFTAFSDTDNIKSYVVRIFNQVFQIWNAQLTIAYKTGQPLKNNIKTVLDKEYK